MKDSTRARVAAVVVAAASKRAVSHVFDYSDGGHKSISAGVRNRGVSGYDYSTSSHFATSGNDLSFFDYETSSHVQLKLKGSSFTGYDYHSQRHFSGTVRGRAIALFDHETGRYHNYSA